MPLSSKTNTINALGIFGRMTPKLEQQFGKLSQQYSHYPKNDMALGIFNHLSLVIGKNVPIGETSIYLDLLRELKPYLPFKLQTNGVIIKDDRHLALSFDTKQTQKIRTLASQYIPQHVVTTYYTKVVWYVHKPDQPIVKEKLDHVKEMIFSDFILVANRQDDKNTLYSSTRYKSS